MYAESLTRATADPFYRRVLGDVGVALWELDYTGVDLRLDDVDFRDEKELIRRIIERPDRFVGVLDQVRVVSLNNAAVALAGLTSPEEAIEQSQLSFVRGAARAAWPAQLAALALGWTDFVREVVGRSEAGAPLPCKLYWHAAATDEEGIPTRAIVAIVDETPHTDREATVSEVRKTKADLLSGLAADFERPLALASASLKSLNSDPAFATGRWEEGPVRSIGESLQASRDLAADMMAMAGRATALPIIRSVNVEAEVRRVLASFPAADAAAVKVDGSGMTALADSGIVRQIVRCLLANSVEHGSPPIVVNLISESVEVHIDVVDHGHGVSEDAVARLFTEGRCRSVPYKGRSCFAIDLPLARLAAESMGGSLEYLPGVDSTTFRLSLLSR